MTDSAYAVLVVFTLFAYLESRVEFLLVLDIGYQVKQPVPPALNNIFDGNHI